METIRPTRAIRIVRGLSGSLEVTVAAVAIWLAGSALDVGFVGAIAWVMGIVWIAYRSARLSTTLNADTIIARNMFADHVVARDRVEAIEECEIWSVQGFRLRVSSPTLVERIRGGIPLEGTASLDADAKNRTWHSLQAWRHEVRRR